PSMIQMTELHPLTNEIYEFYLPRYQLKGTFNAKTGAATLNVNGENYLISKHASSFGTGIMVGKSSQSKPSDCLLLMPVQPFYTEKQKEGHHYKLIHDLQQKLNENPGVGATQYAVFQTDSLGKLMPQH